MKKGLWVALTMLLALTLLAGCTPKQPPAGDQGGSDEPKLKEEIIFAQGQDIYSLVPWFTRLQRTTGLTGNIFEGLVFFDPDMEIEFRLGKSYEWKDGTTLVFQIRDDVIFHNGEKMTAEDVAYSLNTLANEPYMAQNSAWMKEVEVTGEWEVTIHLEEPYGAAIGALCHPANVIAPKAYMEDPSKPYEKMPVGTGPFKMKDYKVGEYYTLERHEDYWGGPSPTKYLTMKIIPEASQRTIMLETGDIDVAYEIPMNDYKKVQNNSNLQLLVSDSMKMYMLNMNCTSENPVGNKLVRQAIMHGIDSADMVESMMYGYGKPASGISVPAVIGFVDRSEDLKYDPELARELLVQAGYPDGCDVTIWTSSEQNRVEMCQIFQDQLKDVGINLIIEQMDQNSAQALIDAGEDFGIWVHFQNNMPKHIHQTFATIYWTPSMSAFNNYSNAEMDELILAIQGVAEADTDRLMELSRKVNDIGFEDVPAIPTYNEPILIAAKAGLEGLRISQVGAHQYKHAKLYVK